MTSLVRSRSYAAISLITAALLMTANTPSSSVAAGGATIVRAVTNYFGKESAGEAAEWLTKKGGKEVAERLTTKATTEGGEATVLEPVEASALRADP